MIDLILQPSLGFLAFSSSFGRQSTLFYHLTKKIKKYIHKAKVEGDFVENFSHLHENWIEKAS